MDSGGDLLSVLLVRDTVDLHVRDIGMGVEELFDLPRVDILAAPDDHVLRPAGYPDVSILVHDRQVSGVEPAVLVYGFLGPLGHLVVALHNEVSACQ